MINYSFFPADARLSEYIFSYGMMEVNDDLTSPLLSPPNGLTGFVIRTTLSKSDVVAKDFEGNLIAFQPSYVIGQTSYPITGYVIGSLKCFFVFFQPLGLYQLFGTKMSDLTNKSIDLFDFLGQETAQNLIEKLFVNDSIESQTTVMNHFFLNQKNIYNDCLVLKKALELIRVKQGNVTVKEIEETCKINRRSLERYFQDKIGLTPKIYIQVYRFKCTMNYLQQNPQTTWSELSNELAFFDQAHMIRYFKKYIKVSPNNMVSLDVDFMNYFLRH